MAPPACPPGQVIQELLLDHKEKFTPLIFGGNVPEVFFPRTYDWQNEMGMFAVPPWGVAWGFPGGLVPPEHPTGTVKHGCMGLAHVWGLPGGWFPPNIRPAR